MACQIQIENLDPANRERNSAFPAPCSSLPPLRATFHVSVTLAIMETDLICSLFFSSHDRAPKDIPQNSSSLPSCPSALLPLSVYSIVSLVTTCCFCKIDVRLLLLALCFHDSLESTQSGGLLPLFAPVLTFGFFLHNVRCVSVMTVVIDLDCLLLNPQLRVRTNAPQRSALKSPGGLRTMARMDEVVAIAASRVSLVSCPIWRSRFAMQVEFSSQERSRPS